MSNNAKVKNGKPGFFSVIFSPQTAIPALAQDPVNSASLKPGLVWLAWVEGAF